MLTELRITNFAIIESLTVSLSSGFNVLTGETGAGKSIVVGALGLLLGERASPDLIRTGAARASVEAVFDIAGRSELMALLEEQGIDHSEPVVVLRREIAASGRSRAWVNDTNASAALLARIGRLLVNLHGQHEAETLLGEGAQRDVLDAFGGSVEQAARVHAVFDTAAAAARELETLRARQRDAERRADYLRFVAEEIEHAAPASGEDAQLEEEAHKLEHAEELESLATGMALSLDGEDGAVLPTLATVQRSLDTIQRIDASLARLQELFDSGYYALEELARTLSEYAHAVERDPARLDAVQRRRDLLFALTRKYGPTLDDVIAAGRSARAELALLDTAALDLESLERRRDEARNALVREAASLTRSRAEAATHLETAVEAMLPELGMPNGRLEVRLVPRAAIAATGAEDIEFRVAFNVGHEARPLARVASGGELSRVMLALKTILARLDRVPTLVFDEVDAGIGGRVGLQVGDTMRRVAAHHQVLAISHLAQIAARAHHHIVVTKGEDHGMTTAATHVVEGDARVAEIARMLGGDSESDVSRAHARELLDHAADAAPAPAPSRRKLARKK
ncbi:MAG TPA: DNA repair protein RecN [Gemmatimonadaceae bacterium]|nr:DNA repair protein RecN [Gemmatimonadaceae bacterium]